MSSYPVIGEDLDVTESDDIIKFNPKYNKILSSNKKYTKRASSLEKIAAAIKSKSDVKSLHDGFYFETAVIDKVLKLIDEM